MAVVLLFLYFQGMGAKVMALFASVMLVLSFGLELTDALRYTSEVGLDLYVIYNLVKKVMNELFAVISILFVAGLEAKFYQKSKVRRKCMKFHCKNELSLLSFDEAVVKEFKIEKDTIQMQFSGGVVKADNSQNGRFQDMFCGEITLWLHQAKLVKIVKEGMKIL